MAKMLLYGKEDVHFGESLPGPRAHCRIESGPSLRSRS